MRINNLGHHDNSKAFKLRRLLSYAWASPCSLIGICLGLTVLFCGGRARIKQHAIEFTGGYIGKLAYRLPNRIAFCAITFGHTILAVDSVTAQRVRAHEQVHVRQYERWGVLFFIAYPLSSLIEVVKGNHPYLDNHFEREARKNASHSEEGCS